MDSEWSHDQTWPGELRDVRSARDFVTGRLEDRGLPALVDSARLVVSELATNAVRHARTPFSVTLQRAGGTVVLRVQDGSDLGPVPGAPELLSLGGRGLLMVAASSAAWGVTPVPGGGKSVWATLVSADGPG
jgi:anti-sigma regulatory factor (Ser/Thr protein kinase)